jgi:hypothetical protein
MMITEGVGTVAPNPVGIMPTTAAFHCCLMEAKRRAEFRGYKSKSTAWEKGHTGKIVLQSGGVVDDSTAPIMAGLIGEAALASFINGRFKTTVCNVDFSLNNFGDGGIDLQPFGFGIDAKTRLKDYGSNLVRAISERGYQTTIKCDAFVFCQWLGGSSKVDLLGWIYSKHVTGLPIVPGRNGKPHKNYEVPSEMLQPMSALLDYLEARRMREELLRGTH